MIVARNWGCEFGPPFNLSTRWHARHAAPGQRSRDHTLEQGLVQAFLYRFSAHRISIKIVNLKNTYLHYVVVLITIFRSMC
jgi:hypothetical protein